MSDQVQKKPISPPGDDWACDKEGTESQDNPQLAETEGKKPVQSQLGAEILRMMFRRRE